MFEYNTAEVAVRNQNLRIWLSKNRREFPNTTASPDKMLVVTPSLGWDRGKGSETRPRKTGFQSHSLLTEQHTTPRVSHEKNLRHFSVQVEEKKNSHRVQMQRKQ